MANNLSDYFENIITNYIFRDGTFTRPSVLAMALLSTAAAESDSGVFSSGTGVEVTNAGAYARKDHPNGTSNWDAASGGATQNSSDITFTQATADWTAAPIVAMAICDSASYNSGNMYFHGPLTASKTVLQNDTFKFLTGDLDVSFL